MGDRERTMTAGAAGCLLCAVGALAAEPPSRVCTHEDAVEAGYAAANGAGGSTGAAERVAIAAEASRPPRAVPAALVEALAPSPAGAYERLAARAWEAAPADWRTIRDLRVLELWDNHYLTVFLGLDRRGRPGLHLTQTRLGADPDAGSTLARLRSVRAGPR